MAPLLDQRASLVLFFQGGKQHTADAGSGGKSHGTVGKAVSRQPLLPA